MVKIRREERLKVLKKMLNRAQQLGTRLPLAELEYKHLKTQKSNGNKNLLEF